MAAKPHQQGQANASRQGDAVCETVCAVACCILLVALVIASTVLLCSFLNSRYPSEGPVFSVAVVSVAGLDPARDLSAAGGPTLSPVLNLTVHVNNARNSYSRACVRTRATATVLYADAFLGRGSVPGFCAGGMRESERVVRVWGQDVLVPGFLRDQLAGELAVGEAAVDVQVIMPGGCSSFLCTDWMLVCNAKIGGGLSRCELTEVSQGSTKPDARSTI